VIETGFVQNFEKTCMGKEDKRITVNMSLSLMPDKKRILISTKDVTYLKQLASKMKLLEMNEMMGNIAHQWRQPLSVISAIASGIGIKHDFGLLDEEALTNSIESIILQVNYLSETIDDFRNFIKDVDEFQKLSLGTMLQKTFAIIKPTLAVNQILLIDEINDDMIIQGYENQLIQAFINIINNAKDAIIKNIKNEEDRLILVTTKKFENKLEISIQDSGGGILSDAIEHLFEPYFTTKHQSVGTGMGLSMVYKIFTEKHNATIKVENVWFEYNQKDYKGACFSIVFEGVNIINYPSS
jgi:signal transduction histidine kinase